MVIGKKKPRLIREAKTLWSMEYARRIGIPQLCREVNVINDEIVRARANVSDGEIGVTVLNLEYAYLQKCTELLIVLKNHLSEQMVVEKEEQLAQKMADF